jgi:hypothetical protein
MRKILNSSFGEVHQFWLNTEDLISLLGFIKVNLVLLRNYGIREIGF